MLPNHRKKDHNGFYKQCNRTVYILTTFVFNFNGGADRLQIHTRSSDIEYYNLLQYNTENITRNLLLLIQNLRVYLEFEVGEIYIYITMPLTLFNF